jgi:hypothetical protein
MKGGLVVLLLFHCGVLVLSLYDAYHQDVVALPGEASPEFVTITELDKRKGMLGFEYRCQRPVHELQILERNGRRVQQTTIAHVNERQDFLVSLKAIRVYDAKGQWLWPVVAMDRLKSGATILKSADGKKVNPRYLPALRPDVLILVVPAEPVRFTEELAPDKK